MAVKSSLKNYKFKNSPPKLGYGADILSGAMNGTSMGASLGPLGAAGGAIVGGVAGLFKAKADKERQDALDKEMATNKARNLRQVNDIASRAILQNFPSQGIERPMMGKGGIVKKKPTVDAISGPDVKKFAKGGEVPDPPIELEDWMMKPNPKNGWFGSTNAYDSFGIDDIRGMKRYPKESLPEVMKAPVDSKYNLLLDEYTGPSLTDEERTRLIRAWGQMDESTANEGLTSWFDSLSKPKEYGKGGNVSPDYIAEGGEVVSHSPFRTPMTDKSGSLKRLSAGLSKINGSKHSSDTGGVAMKGGERVYSDQVPVPKHLLRVLKKL